MHEDNASELIKYYEGKVIQGWSLERRAAPPV